MFKRQKITDRDRRIGKILAILREVEAMPRNWTKGADAWKKRVGLKHGVALGTIYRWREKYNRCGRSGLEHHKANCDQPKTWSSAALDYWIGQALLPANRKIDLRSLYQDVLIIEAQRRSWKIGGWSSARWWLQRRAKLLMRILP
jgi:hypothetical protein